MQLLLAIALLAGPPVESAGRIALRVHVGRSRESAVVRSELSRDQEWFLARRLAISVNYRIELIEDLYDQRPCYQIGKGDERHEFPPGTFTGSGTFLLTLSSVAKIDHWERENPYLAGGLSWWNNTDELTSWDAERMNAHYARLPEVFPPGSWTPPKFQETQPVDAPILVPIVEGP